MRPYATATGVKVAVVYGNHGPATLTGGKRQPHRIRRALNKRERARSRAALRQVPRA